MWMGSEWERPCQGCLGGSFAAAGTSVEKVEALTKGFKATLLENGEIELQCVDASLKAATYTVKMNVHLTNQATNQKPISVSIKVVLKK